MAQRKPKEVRNWLKNQLQFLTSLFSSANFAKYENKWLVFLINFRWDSKKKSEIKF